jgi:hypothetical protein
MSAWTCRVHMPIGRMGPPLRSFAADAASLRNRHIGPCMERFESSRVRHSESQGACRESATSNRHRYPVTRAETVRVSSASSNHCVGRKTTPSGTTPCRTNRHRAISSLRAKATIMGLRALRAFSVRARYHCAKATLVPPTAKRRMQAPRLSNLKFCNRPVGDCLLGRRPSTRQGLVVRTATFPT